MVKWELKTTNNGFTTFQANFIEADHFPDIKTNTAAAARWPVHLSLPTIHLTWSNLIGIYYAAEEKAEERINLASKCDTTSSNNGHKTKACNDKSTELDKLWDEMKKLKAEHNGNNCSKCAAMIKVTMMAKSMSMYWISHAACMSTTIITLPKPIAG